VPSPDSASLALLIAKIVVPVAFVLVGTADRLVEPTADTRRQAAGARAE
jgi:hypothetical protein